MTKPLTKDEQQMLNAILNTYDLYDDPDTIIKERKLLKALKEKLVK